MSSGASKQDMSMDDILASIRSYVSEGQNLPKSEAKLSNVSNVIQLTDEVIPIETVSIQPATVASTVLQQVKEQINNPMYPTAKVAPNPFDSLQANPFNRLESEIKSSVVSDPTPTLSTEDLLGQLASPLIKSWLDQNLRKIVEETVQKEIDRMRRG